MKPDNVLVNSSLCCGCGTCAAICPKDAIKLVINWRKGIYVPLIDNDKCSQCGLCLKVCPGKEVNFSAISKAVFPAEPSDYRLGYYRGAYLAYSTDHLIRYNSSSGGLITSLLLYMLEKGLVDGALVSIVDNTKPLVPQPHIACTAEEIIDASKSKYCPIPVNAMLKDIIESSIDKRFVVVGLPCHLHGLRKWEMLDRSLEERILLRIGLFCEACPTFLATDFFIRNHDMDPVDVIRFEYRGRGWPGSVLAETSGGRQAEEPYQDVWSIWKHGFLSPRCALCIDKANEMSDIAVADPWCLVQDETIGSSLAIVRTQQAEDILEKMGRDNRLNIQPMMDIDTLIKGQGFFIKKKMAVAEMKLSGWLGASKPVYITGDEVITRVSLTDISKALYRRIMTAIIRQRFLWPLLFVGIPPTALILKCIRKVTSIFC